MLDEWLAVEEAVVGGLVYVLVPEVVLRRIADLPREWIQADLEKWLKIGRLHFLSVFVLEVVHRG